MGSTKWTSCYHIAIALVIANATLLVCEGLTPEDDETDHVPAIYIVNFSVPNSIETGSKEYLTLDCDYVVKPNETELLEVTWFYNTDSIVYKWIYSNNLKKPYGILQNRTDLNYKASDTDYEMYRALRIRNPTPDLSGEYTCSVSTKHGFASKSSHLTIYSKPEYWDLKQVYKIEDTVGISCVSNGAHPTPELKLYYRQIHPKSGGVFLNSYFTSNQDDHNSVSMDISIKKGIGAIVIFFCDFKIPNTSYLRRKTLLYKGE